MLIIFSCSKCEARLEVESAASGTVVPCPRCQASLTVPLKGVGPGTTVGGFRIEKLIGRGGMGQVFLARQLSLNRPVALKILPSHMARDPESVRLFMNEVRLLARLNHPHVVPAYEAGEDAGILYLAMGYVDGESLERKLKRDGPLPERDALLLTKTVAQVLDYAWKTHRLLHRDIKPSNILLDSQGRPKLVDLGLAKSLAGKAGLIPDQAVMGTPNYMSPEQMAGRQDVDCRCDMYSLGMTLYHALTARVPYGDVTMAEVVRKQGREPLPDPRDLNPRITRRCVELLEIMLGRSPHDRHAGWVELIRDLDRVLAGEHPRHGPSRRTDSTLMRIEWAGGGDGEDGSGPAPAKPGRSRIPTIIGVAALAVIAAGAGMLVGYLLHRPESGTDAGRVPQPAAGPITVEAPKAGGGGNAAPPADGRPPAGVAQPALPSPEPTPQGGTPRVPSAAETSAAAGRPASAPVRSVERRTTDTGPAETPATGTALAPNALAELCRAVAECLLRQDVQGALDELDKAGAGKPSAPREIEAMVRSVKAVSHMPDVILNSFALDRGKSVPVRFASGTTETLYIAGVAGPTVQGQRLLAVEGAAASVPRPFGVGDLAIDEQLARLGTGTVPDLELMRGILLARKGDLEAAKQALTGGGMLGWAVGRSLMARARSGTTAAKAVDAPAITPSGAASIRPASLRGLQGKTADAFIRQLAADLSNDSRHVPITIREYRFVEDRLVYLNLAGNESLLSVQSLKGLPLTQLILADCTALTSLNGIETMPLTSLNLYRCRGLKSIDPVAGMKLTRLILWGCSGLRGNLKALKGMPLSGLSLAGCSSLNSLAGIEALPLTGLDVSSCTGLVSLEPLAGMKLTSLVMNNCTGLKGGLGVLKGMPLTHLSLWEVPLSNLAELKGLPLTSLDLTRCSGVVSLDPLAGMKLKFLSLRGCSGLKGDLTALRGMPLVHLNLAGCTSLRRLTGIEDAPLGSVIVTGCEKLNPADVYQLKKQPGIKVTE